ncbi:hypothetical protein Tco_0072830 [Tanacetum coccineum]
MSMWSLGYRDGILITNNEINIWKVIQNSNSLKRTGRDCDGRVIILPPTIADEHIAVKRESKARTTLLQISEAEGLHKGYDRMQKILSQLNQLKAKPEDEDINLKFLRLCLIMSTGIALTLKTKGGLEFLSFDDLYYKLKTLEVDIKGYSTFSSSQSAGPNNSAFVSATSTNRKMSYVSYSSSTYTVPSNSKTGSQRSEYTSLKQKAGRKMDFDKENLQGNKKKVICVQVRFRDATCQRMQGKGRNDKQDIVIQDSRRSLRSRVMSYCSKEFGMIAGCDNEDEIEEGAAKIYNLITGVDTKEVENELGWDDSAFSVFTTNSEEVEGRPLFNRFAKADSMKAVPPPLSGDYTPLSDHIDLDESQMSYGTKSSTSGDSNSVSNDFVSCDNSDKSSEVNTNDFASSDSSVKSSEPKSNDSTSCASTSSVSTSENEAEIESNVGTPIQEPIIVQDLPSFSCNSSDKNENTSRTSCNKNGYFNKKAGHFRKTASSVSKLCFVCGSSTHLIKDCDFYEKQMANKTVGNGMGPVHSRNNVNHQNQFVPQAVLLRTGKVFIPAARPNQVPAGRPKPVSTGRPKSVSTGAPVSTGKQNRPPPVHAGRRNSSSVTSGWWQSTARPMAHLPSPTSSYFQTSTPFGPHFYCNQMQYGGLRWATAVKPSSGVPWENT